MSSSFECGKVSKSEHFYIDLYHNYSHSDFNHEGAQRLTCLPAGRHKGAQREIQKGIFDFWMSAKDFFTTFGATKSQ
jgi:hypothetical protein